MQARWLADGPDENWPGKARTLARLAAAGLEVPRGLVLPLTETLHPVATSAIERLLQEGPVIARCALAGEDTEQHSAAGLGESRAGLETLDGLRDALGAMARNLDDPWLSAYRRDTDPQARDFVIVQHQVERRALIVAALTPDDELYIEVHDAPGEVLAQGSTPSFAGRIRSWTDAAASAVERSCRSAGDLLGLERYGLDLELVLDAHGRVAIVQARPITVPLQPGWEPFCAALGPAERAELHGTLVLDAEHNPAPLSPAHAWVMRWLAEHEPRSGTPTILAGWLYVRTLVRNLADERESPAAAPLTVHQALELLQTDLLPQARARLHDVEERLRSADSAPQAAAVLEPALDAFLAMIRVYIDQLVPACAAARPRAGNAWSTPEHAGSPLTIRDRASFADVLPAAWDIASPSLGELVDIPADAASPELPADTRQAALLLGEWDDHLFALGLAPLRRVWMEVGRRMEIDAAVFMLDGPEMIEAARRGRPDHGLLRRRAAMQRSYALLHPPVRIEEGRPIPVPPAARLTGVSIGVPFEGPLTHRLDLEDLLARPPRPDEVVTLPALTAQSAVVLVQTGVRAVCCEHGGAMSHAALMARELGLSALIGCRGCRALPEGQRVRLDTNTGRLRISARRPEIKSRPR